MAVSLPEKLVTGIADIDDQHRALIHWARTINTIDASNGGQTTLREGARFLVAYAKYHFTSEEHAMAAARYQKIDQHRREHQMLRRQLAKMIESVNAANYGSDITTICAMQRLIREWIQNHISASDLAFAGHCEQRPEMRRIQLPSPQELEKSGVSVADIDMVEAVHNAGEITGEELPKRMILKIRE